MILASPPLLTVWLSIAAVLAYSVPAVAGHRLTSRTAHGTLIAAWVVHALVIVTALFQEQPRFGFAPALSITAWLVLTAYAVESHRFPQLRARFALAGLGAAAVLLAWAFPGAPLHAAASPWLPLHWALGLASYGLFAAAVVHAWLMTRSETQIRQAVDPSAGVPLLTLERLTFRFVLGGFVLLTATLLAGWFFRDMLYAPGSSNWRWDHKTVFALLSWLTFATLLFGRQRFGWRGRKAVRVLYTGAVLLLLSYVGSRFVMEVILNRAA
jgi:ABC-type uncharacterized transport system permease subunit